MELFKTLLSLIGFCLLITTTVEGQYGDPVMDMNTLMQQHSDWTMQMQQYNQQMDAYMLQQMNQAQQRADQAYADVQRFFIDYYRQHTGDYATPDQQAVLRGDQLWCQHNPAQCQQNIQQGEAWSRMSARHHAENMANTQAWGDTMRQTAQTYSDISNMSHQGYVNRSAMTSEGQANYVQGAVHGEATYTNPSSGTGYSLPVYPDPNMSYTTPEGYPLAFDYQTNTWYQGDGNGWWYPLNRQ